MRQLGHHAVVGTWTHSAHALRTLPDEYFEAARADLVNELSTSTSRECRWSPVTESTTWCPWYRQEPIPSTSGWSGSAGHRSLGYVVAESDHRIIYGRAVTVMVAADIATADQRPCLNSSGRRLSQYLREDGP